MAKRTVFMVLELIFLTVRPMWGAVFWDGHYREFRYAVEEWNGGLF